METPKKKRFVFEVSIDEIPHNEDTVQYAYGEDASYIEYPEQTHATEAISSLFQDLICHYLREQMSWMADESKAPETSDNGERTKASCQHMIKWNKDKENLAIAVSQTIKFKKVEEIPVDTDA